MPASRPASKTFPLSPRRGIGRERSKSTGDRGTFCWLGTLRSRGLMFMVSGKAACWAALGLALIAGAFVRGYAGENKDAVFWEVRRRQEVGAAAQLVLARNPLAAALLRDEGLRWKVWQEPEYIGDAVPPLNPDWLDLVRDG